MSLPPTATTVSFGKHRSMVAALIQFSRAREACAAVHAVRMASISSITRGDRARKDFGHCARISKADSTSVLLAPSGLLDVCGIVARSGNQIYATREQPEVELVRYDARSRQFQSSLGGISAEYVSLSRDGRWVAYSSFPEGDLWRARVDGTEKLKLASGMFALSIGWSPDGGKSVSWRSNRSQPSM